MRRKIERSALRCVEGRVIRRRVLLLYFERETDTSGAEHHLLGQQQHADDRQPGWMYTAVADAN